MRIRPGTRLPDARLATMGGRSFAFHEFQGRKILIYGWASWSPSRDALPILQKFYDERRSSLELVSVAFDVTGMAAPMRCLKSAGADHVMLIDATCTLTRRWSIRRVPFLFLLDENRVVLQAGEAVDESGLAEALNAKWEKTALALPELPAEESRRLYEVEIQLQACTNFLGRKRAADAVEALRKALTLDPENEIVREQLRALESR